MKNRIPLIIGITVTLVIVIVAVQFYNLKTRNAVERLAYEKKMINILVVGSSKYNNGKNKFFAVVSINPVNKRIGVTFIPPSYGLKKDDSTYERIDEIVMNNYNRLRHSLWQDIHLNIPFYVELYGPDVKRLVNLFEGINMYMLDQEKKPVLFKQGKNYLDGEKAFKYINSVENNSIFLKYDRIQDILFTLYHKKAKLERFKNIAFMKEISRSLKTNILPQEMLSICEIVMGKGNMVATMLPGGFKEGYYYIDDITYKMYEEEFIKLLIVDKDIDQHVKIKILNATDTPGMARKYRNTLIRDGMNVVEFGTSENKKYKKSMIINRKGNYTVAQKISELTGIQTIYHVIDNTLLYSVLIILGDDTVK